MSNNQSCASGSSLPALFKFSLFFSISSHISSTSSSNSTPSSSASRIKNLASSTLSAKLSACGSVEWISPTAFIHSALPSKTAIFSHDAGVRPPVWYYYCNSRSFKNKLSYLYAILYSKQYSVCCVTETWLSPFITDGMFRLQRYV